MYIPKAFEETDLEQLHNLIRAHNFGVLFSQTASGPFATHLPFMIDSEEGRHGTLIGHFAKGNPHWEALREDQEILVVFQGAHSYISPNWYANQVTVPTWNYAVVHAYGKPHLTHDKQELLDMVSSLVELHEADREPRWDIETADPIMDAELSGIVGIRIPIDRIEGKYKFNQNRPTSDQMGVVEALEYSEDPLQIETAQIMQQNIDKKRNSS